MFDASPMPTRATRPEFGAPTTSSGCRSGRGVGKADPSGSPAGAASGVTFQSAGGAGLTANGSTVMPSLAGRAGPTQTGHSGTANALSPDAGPEVERSPPPVRSTPPAPRVAHQMTPPRTSTEPRATPAMMSFRSPRAAGDVFAGSLRFLLWRAGRPSPSRPRWGVSVEGGVPASAGGTVTRLWHFGQRPVLPTAV